MNNQKPSLYLIPTPIGISGHHFPLTGEILEILPQIKHFLVENVRSARRFLKAAGCSFNDDDTFFTEISEHNQFEIDNTWIKPLFEGYHLGVLSEAGLPCIADPGFTIVQLAHQYDFPVIPLSGTSSIFKALMASGLNGQKFTFHGYLPVDKDNLKKKLREIEISIRHGYTQIFIETPYRNDRLTEFMVTSLMPDTMLSIAAGIDTAEMLIKTKTVRSWKSSLPKLKGIPTVFLVGS